MFNLSLTACSFYLRETNSRGFNKIFNLNSPIEKNLNGKEYFFADAIELFSAFFKHYKNMIDNNDKKQTFSCEFDPTFAGETDGFHFIYAKIMSGLYGSSSDIIDPLTKQIKFSKAASDIDTRPFYVFVIVPKNTKEIEVQKGLLIFQNVGQYGIKTLTTNYMQKFFSSYFQISLNCRTIAPNLFVKKIIRRDNLQKLVMIKNIKSADDTDNMDFGYGKEVREVGNLKFSENGWQKILKSINWVAGGKHNLFEFEGEAYSTLKVVVDIGGRKRIIDLHNLENLSIIESIPDEIKMADGHPNIELLVEYFKKVAAEYINEMVLKIS